MATISCCQTNRIIKIVKEVKTHQEMLHTRLPFQEGEADYLSVKCNLMLELTRMSPYRH